MTWRQFFIVYMTLLLVSCGGEPLSKEKQLQADLDQMELLAEEKNTSDLMDYLDDRFKHEGGWNKKDIQRMLHFRFMKHKTVHITKVVKDIDWRSDNEVHLVVVAALAGSPIGDLTQLTGARAQLMKFEVLLVRNEGRFLVRSVKWAHAYPTDFI
ncbi:hypothetical protein [Marinicella rhabdoformis]|uniref:hypothetical protein n=1 Tax=Marinicella rhabdoformis TaxID=2580566 RepID=UPI0012AEE03D|nr:hypothetical protein [Marinicella rhabdoformis]